MRREGLPIEGFCVAAGISSTEKAAEIIAGLRDAGIRHVAFKPGSVEGIRQVVAIAAANPDFPVPVLQTYRAIRQHSNICLVGGSGFGAADDVGPYLSGECALAYEMQPMPFDGSLLASRVMVAKEAHTSPSVKDLIVAAAGVDDANWEGTYVKPTGGILTVRSELGEPIHKVATRGVKLWKEFDDTVFKLPKEKRVTWLVERRDEVIEKLNRDFSKPWFGWKKDGSVATELGGITYEETVLRMRFAGVNGGGGKPSILQSYNSLDDPLPFIESFFKEYPTAREQLLAAEDSAFFLAISQRPGQKPVPFIPGAVLDASFEVWYKKKISRRSSIRTLSACVGMVLPGDELSVKIRHVGMATATWYADAHLLAVYGFSIVEIVKDNPKEKTIHFGGIKGQAIRRRYMDMSYDTMDKDGNVKTLPLFADIDVRTPKYTFSHPSGLLFATQFAQIALVVTKKAAFEDMRMKGYVQKDCAFAGHSLGEYSALASVADVLAISALVDVVFYRGQRAVERDLENRSNYAMCAVNPSCKVGATWEYSSNLTGIYLDILHGIATSGTTFKYKNALLTGVGKGSIGVEIVKGLLSGGAHVVITTSRYSRSTVEYYQSIFQTFGSGGSALTVVPFNQGSKQDVEALVDYIYANHGTDLDHIIPFAGVPENGREIDGLDDKSELAHRIMLVNLLRILGAVKTKKAMRHFVTRPTQVNLPLSPNHGLFGNDGLYSESKISLETLFQRWSSESWGEYLCLAGAVIGSWTRGTGLMGPTNIVAHELESYGVRTFSAKERAFNILGFMVGLTRRRTASPPHVTV
ncbi:acyl transferase domain-containing protein [Mycena belliarum]|uniref:Acyl transferase domain-containing protein n=1 Tax=Mycena belliarum TaxID=1033014 RepID=A0AAD6XL49_9AGAR|nr:acyl transferase domain-containing protein [Mycena belliae]